MKESPAVHLPRHQVEGLAKCLVWFWVTISTAFGALIVLSTWVFWGSGPFEPADGMTEAEFAKLKETPNAFLWADIALLLFGLALTLLPLSIMLRRHRAGHFRRL